MGEVACCSSVMDGGIVLVSQNHNGSPPEHFLLAFGQEYDSNFLDLRVLE